jgi:hypothetical protein
LLKSKYGGADFVDIMVDIFNRCLMKLKISVDVSSTVKETFTAENGKSFAYVEKPEDSTLISVANTTELFLLPGEEVSVKLRSGSWGDSYIATSKNNPVAMDISFNNLVSTTLTLTFTSPYTDVALNDYIYSTLVGEFRFSKTGESNEALDGTISSVSYSTVGGYSTATATVALDSAGSVDTSWTLFSTYLSIVVSSGSGGGVDNLDGGRADSIYGGTTPIDGGGA